MLVLAAGSLLDGDADTVVDAAAVAGFDAVGLRVCGPHAVSDGAAFARRAAGRGVVVHDTEVFRIGTDDLAQAGELLTSTRAVGAGRLLVVSDDPDDARTVAELCRLVELAGRLEVTIGLEYMAWTTPSDPRSAIDVAERTGCELVVDVLHHLRVGGSVADLHAIVASGRLGWVQLCDATAAPPTGDGALIDEARHHRLAPGDGELPLDELLAAVPADVPLSVEVQCDDWSSLAAAERARRLHAATTAVLDRVVAQRPSSTG